MLSSDQETYGYLTKIGGMYTKSKDLVDQIEFDQYKSKGMKWIEHTIHDNTKARLGSHC